MPGNSMQRAYLAEMDLGVCWSGIRGGERGCRGTENSPVDTGLRGLFHKCLSISGILNLTRE